MDQNLLSRYDKLGQYYWWLVAKYKTILKLTAKFTKIKKNKINILDIGCASGGFLEKFGKFLEQNRNYKLNLYGIDIVKNQELSKKKKIKFYLIKKGEKYPFPKNSFNIITLIDVLEHIKNERFVLKEIYRILKRDGYIVLSVPAYQFLWGKHDQIYKHFRRYTKSRITHLLEKNSFKILKATYFQSCFIFPLWFYRKFFSKNNSDDFLIIPKILNNILTKVLLLEGWVSEYISLPFGSTIICIAKRMDKFEK